MPRATPILLCVGVIGVALSLGGCVERRMTITSEPSNALVYLNGREWGRTPIERDFLWYGNYDVAVRAEGRPTLKTTARVTAPWWQWPPFDLVAELMPWHPVDRQNLHFTLPQDTQTDTPAQTLVSRAVELKADLGNPRH